MELIFLLLALLIVFISQQILNATYSKYKKISVSTNISGKDVANRILNEYDLNDIKVVSVSGNLTDHFNNNKRTISLSDDIYYGCTIASCAVAAHECGHAIQYKEKYPLIKIRNLIVPFVNVANTLGYWVIAISLIASLTNLFKIGLLLICFALLFQILTLPVEFNASKRANKILIDLGLINNDEKKYTKTMLRAAAFTYVAGLISSILQILRLVYIFSGKKRK